MRIHNIHVTDTTMPAMSKERAHSQAITNHYVTCDLCIERVQISRLLMQRNGGR